MKWGNLFDIASIGNQIEELEQKASEPDFWNDTENSQKILQKIKSLRSKVERYNKLVSQWEDLITLCELGIEEQDESVIPEAVEGFKAFKKEFEALRLETLLTGQYDKNNAILTLHAGAGGTEAQDWVQMLFRMYTRWAEKKGFTVKVLDYLDGEEAGIKSVTFQVIGENAYGFLKSEKGVHRLVRISPFDASGRRHTSFASLDVMPELNDDIEVHINPDDLRIDTYRSSGAGGQHINKTESAVRITHIPTGIVVSCQSERSQFQNKDTAMKMLKAKLMELKERENKEKIEDLKGIQLEIAWGSQIRSYVFCPYTLVKDHRTNYEEINVDAVMDGELDGFINSYLSSVSKDNNKEKVG
ncbi:peptide chain release factor 2 (bRF-2) [Acetivibrio thermocellus AD2]|jgi:peptide chain release factor 2|uniref:Peptide chain release factor 2 n=1 Tax=Acetivibrio thermocellus AD2 TaxID=1138384 RepID=A0AB36TI22_ACETH|nr:Peptide chain release factor 2 [Acetivibrio thermocellus AD2]ANV76617.1 Peptide chain release factor 2 [Acetivibrio thermocellus DSM 2360]EIC05154.1 peptide chain release factor 2 [Acetivibrio thermocellus YS]PFH03140.1 peptide chain release factor 2 (bRF-2) [Acetivibrio thermocellus AD2]CDG35042.1 Peptide chain release factor 2 [Acetivibrio thermocellus BC1]